MPLGNLTSQFFANLYLNELDVFAKHKLKAKYYIRYVDDFVILHESKEQLEKWKININNFLKESELQFSVQKTLLHYKKGFTISEISIKEGIKEATVWAHLVNLIENKQLSVWEILPHDKIHKIIRKIYGKKERLRDIKKRINDNSVTYDEIACVMASIKSKNKWKKNKSPVTY